MVYLLETWCEGKLLPNTTIRVQFCENGQIKTNMGHCIRSLASTFSSPPKGEMESTQLFRDIGRIRR